MKKLALALPMIALLGCSAFCSQKALPVFAEGDEPSSSEVVSSSEQGSSEQQSSEPKKFNVDEIVIDGKTIEQWKNELRNDNTRTSAIVGIIVFLAGGFLFAVKWLTEHGLLKNANKAIDETKQFLALESEKLIAGKEELERKKAEFDEAVKAKEAEIEAMIVKAQESVKSYYEETQMNRAMLETIMKTDPTLVANGAWREAKKAMEAAKNGKK